MVASRIGARLGRPVTIAQGRGGLGRFVLRGFAVGDAPSSDSGEGKSQAKSQEKPGAKSDAAPLVTADEILVPFSAAWGGSPITVIGLRVNAVRGGDADNVSDIVTRLRGKHGGADGASPSASSSSSVPGVRVESGSVSVQDSESGLVLKIAGIAGLLAPGRQASVRLRGVSGLIAVGGGDKGPRFGATELDIRTALASGLHRQGYPTVRIQDWIRVAAAHAGAHRHRRRDRPAAAGGRARTGAAASSSICAAATAARTRRSGRRRGTPIRRTAPASWRCAPSSSRWAASPTCCRRRC